MHVARTILDNAVEAVAGTLVGVIAMAVLLSVMYRYVLFRALTWADELPSFLFVWVVFLGAALGVKRGAHFEISAFVGGLPERWKLALRYLALISQAALALFLVVYGWELVELTKENRSPALDIPLAYVYGSVPVSGLLMLLYLVPQFVARLRGEGRSNEGGSQC